MAQVCRVEKTGNYTVMANYHLDDHRLSLKAKGLLSTMLRLPEDWDYTVEGLAALSKDGRDSINTALGELEKFGYVSRHQLHGENGVFSGNEYIIREAPFTENPLTVKPFTENPSTALNKNNNLNNQVLNNQTPKAPKGGRRRKAARKAPDYKPELFERFWKLYPRGEDKQGAMDAWDELQPDEATIAAMSAGLHRALATEEWQRGIGIPYAVRWIRRRRWEDESKAPILDGASRPSGKISGVDEWD